MGDVFWIMAIIGAVCFGIPLSRLMWGVAKQPYYPPEARDGGNCGPCSGGQPDFAGDYRGSIRAHQDDAARPIAVGKHGEHPRINLDEIMAERVREERVKYQRDN